MSSLFEIYQRKNRTSISHGDFVLKPLERRDLARIKSWFADKELSRQAFGMITQDDVLERIVREYFSNIYATSMEILGIWTGGGQLAGFINYSISRSQGLVGRIGIVIGEEAHRNKGMGTKALKIALYYLFDRVGLDAVELDTAFFNNRAQRCFEKCGFIKTGEVTDINMMNGNLVHKVLMKLEREEFFRRMGGTFNPPPRYQEKKRPEGR